VVRTSAGSSAQNGRKVVMGVPIAKILQKVADLAGEGKLPSRSVASLAL
jgi:hypothetical protein